MLSVVWGCKRSCTYVECGLGGVRSHVHVLSVVWGCKKSCTYVECGFGGCKNLHLVDVMWNILSCRFYLV